MIVILFLHYYILSGMLQDMSLSLYYEKISKTPMLTREEELDLFLEYQDVTTTVKRKLEIRSQIIESNLRFVFKEAKKYSRNDPTIFEELIAAGNDGLLVAFDKFNVSSGFRYLTYAGFWTRQRMLFSMSQQRIVSLPIWRQQLSARIQKIIEKNPDITFERLKNEFPDIQEKDLRELWGTRFLTFYISDMDEDPAFEINPIEDEVNTRLDRERLHTRIAALPDDQREVIELSFGIFDGEDRNIAQVAAELKLSKDKVKTLKREALEGLKAAMGGANPFE